MIYTAYNETPTERIVMNEKAKRFVNNLKAQAEANPLAAIAIAAMFVTATSKLIDSNTQRSYAKAHAKEIDRRAYQTYNKTR